jgi:hypothetical protein
MQRTGIIHIGAHKTGSTSIQVALNKSKDRLQSLGINYFNEYDRSVQLLSIAFRHFQDTVPLVNGKFQTISDLKSASYSAWRALHRHVRRENVAYTIISEEFLLRLQNTDRMRRILEQIFDRLFFVVYVRDPIDRMPSSIDQRIRGGAIVDEFIASKFGLPRLLPKLERYATTFGEHNLIVRNFDRRNLKNGSPVSDFSYVLSGIIGNDIDLIEPGLQNQSMPASVTAFLLAHNKRRFLSGEPRDAVWFRSQKNFVKMVRGDPSLSGGGKLRLNEPLITGHIGNIFRDEVAEINDRFLSNQVEIKLGPRGDILTKAQLRKAVENWVMKHDNALVSQSLSRLFDQIF